MWVTLSSVELTGLTTKSYEPTADVHKCELCLHECPVDNKNN